MKWNEQIAGYQFMTHFILFMLMCFYTLLIMSSWEGEVARRTRELIGMGFLYTEWPKWPFRKRVTNTSRQSRKPIVPIFIVDLMSECWLLRISKKATRCLCHEVILWMGSQRTLTKFSILDQSALRLGLQKSP